MGIEDENRIKQLMAEGFKPEDDITRKLCEATGEMMIIASLHPKGVYRTTGITQEAKIKDIVRYIYENEDWQEEKRK